MQIRPISVAELLVHGRELFAAAHASVGSDIVDEGVHEPLRIDESQFYSLEDAGMLLALGLWKGEMLVGYVLGAVFGHHFVARTVCQSLSLFISPEHRTGGWCRQLMDAFEGAASARGARVHWHAKRGSHFATILAKRGAREFESSYVAALQALPEATKQKLLTGEF